MSSFTLRITDGTTTVNCIYGESGTYGLASGSWAPRIADERLTTIAGSGPYTDVDETMRLYVVGQYESDTLRALTTLKQLLTQARQWSLFRNVAPVRLQYSPPGATTSGPHRPLEALIIDRLDGDDSNHLALQPSFNRDLGGYVIGPIDIQFRRQGAWIAGTETQTSSSATIPTVQSVTFSTTRPWYCPVFMDFDPVGTMPTGCSGMALSASQAAAISLISATDSNLGGGGSGWSQVNNSANQAYETNVGRFTPSTPNTWSPTSNAMTPGFTSTHLALFAAVRVNGSPTWFIRASWTVDGITYTSRPYPVPQNSNLPQIIALGTMRNMRPITSIRLQVMASETTGASFDINYAAFLDLTDPCANALVLNGTTQNAHVGADPAPLTQRNPLVGHFSGTTGALIGVLQGYSGNAYITTVGASFAAALLLTDNTRWRPNSSGALSIALEATRYTSAITPE